MNNHLLDKITKAKVQANTGLLTDRALLGSSLISPPNFPWNAPATLGMSLGEAGYDSSSGGDTIFRAHLEVSRVANGYTVAISTKGSRPKLYIAESLTNVNEIITAEMVKMKLEDK